MSPVREPRGTTDLIGCVLAVLAAVTDEVHVNAVVALTAELA